LIDMYNIILFCILVGGAICGIFCLRLIDSYINYIDAKTEYYKTLAKDSDPKDGDFK